MSETEMPKAYDHHRVEEELYGWWEGRGYFTPEHQIAIGQARADEPPFVISMPPPNVTGALHLGHAITSSVQDMLVRYQRMRGRPTLWLPGTDHAGIATQSVVERKLEAAGLSRRELGRERFVQEVWDWKEEHHGRITGQQRRMGISCDWQRERFTLDDGLSDAVLEAFLTLYDEGLIYRGTYLVNWSPSLQTAVSDLEVEYSEEPGTLYFFKYRIKGSDRFIPVATTRPETILGDTAVAVHPDDPRYADLVGKTALVPILDREIPVIADAYVDREFATGALKITPGHDANDYEIGLRCNLPAINIMNRDATLNAEAGPYAGFDRFAARERLWADMEAAGLTIKSEPHTLRVPRSQRGGEVIEPLISTQWFVRMKPLAERAIAAVQNGEIEIVPERFAKIYFHWMENIRDWCISRQLWWGHRIPVWYGPDGQAFAARSEAEAAAQAAAHYGYPTPLEQESDVLDTWFSSGLWPFSTLGWPQESEDLKKYYPTTVMETGYDILFFWVARMIVMGIKFTGQVPFRTVYLHGLVRDENGRKMSKSLGNVLDPLDLIRDYGADALRFTLLTGSTPGSDIKLSVTRVEAGRNFANKIWNAARFVIMNLGDTALELTADADPFSRTATLPAGRLLALADRWILSRLAYTTAEATRLIDGWQLSQAGLLLYEFLWSEFADWYIEAAKVRLYEGTPEEAGATRQVLAHVLEQSLRLLHPFMPFVTETIWQNLPGLADGELGLIVARWPQAGRARDLAAEEAFGRLQEIVRAVRNVRSEYNVEPARRITALFSAGKQLPQIEQNRSLFASLARLDREHLVAAHTLDAPAKAVTLAVGGVTVYLPLADMVDVEAERGRIVRDLEAIDRQLARISGLLNNPGFTGKAPTDVIERERARQSELETKRSQLASHLDNICE